MLTCMKGSWQWYRLVPVTLVMGTIFFLSHQDGSRLELPQIPYIDKAAHFLLYSLLAGTVLYSFPVYLRQYHPERAGIVTIIFCLGYGITDELHQSHIPERVASMSDLIADLSGAVITVLLWLLVSKRFCLHNRGNS